jgi:4'-phosphopantetheinyl transferase
MHSQTQPFSLSREKGVHQAVWSCVFQSEFQELATARDQFLHQREKAYFDTLQFERRQKSYLLGRYAAKTAVAKLLGFSDLKTIEVVSGIFDQPLIKLSGAAEIGVPEITLSHCDGLAIAVAFPREHLLGIDIEKINAEKRSVIETQLTQAEKDWIASQNMNSAHLVFMIWTIKESLSKVLRCGLTTPFSVLEVTQPQYHPETGFQCQFKSFGQYQGLAMVVGEYVLGLVIPRKTKLDPEINTLGKLMIGPQPAPFAAESN